MIKAFILAGGKGTRLRPLTLHTPKPIVPILDRPFLTSQIELLRRAGISKIVLSLSYQPRRIENLFGKGEQLGVKIHYTVEPEPLGTGLSDLRRDPAPRDPRRAGRGDARRRLGPG